MLHTVSRIESHDFLLRVQSHANPSILQLCAKIFNLQFDSEHADKAQQLRNLVLC